MTQSYKKSICIVSPSLKPGGIERALTVLANYFSSLGYKVFFVSAQGGEKFYSLNKEVIFFEPILKRQNGIINKISVYVKIIFFLRKTIKAIKPNVVLSFGDAFNPLVLFALIGVKTPIFISDRTSPDFKFNKIIKIGKKYLYPRSNGFIAQTKRAADYKIKQFNNRLNIKIIPNALKDVRLKNNVKKENSILCVGRLSFEKGQDRLIKAFSKVNDINWRLVLAGSGPQEKQLKKIAKENNILDRIDFLGNVKDVDTLLSKSSIFVLPSRLEGFPNALCEAMAAGLPSICFDSIPTEALLENNKTGIIVKEGDIDSLTNMLNYLIENKEERERIGKNAMQIREKLSIEKIGNEYLSFILN